ncbi:efflux RND transporter periplasmic adaptor subunit [Aquifex sp.]
MGRSFGLALILLILPLLSFSEEIILYAIVKGRVEKVFVKEGEKVRNGDILLKISAELYDAKIRELEARLKKLEVDRWKKERDYKRYKEMFERDLLAESILEEKEAELRRVEYQIQEVKAQIESLKILKKYTEIRSPVNGTVKRILVREGVHINGELIPQKVIVLQP